MAFRATPQWFISMEQAGLRRDALEAIKDVQWIPDWGEARIAGMIDGRPDWCISRQRTWGVPIALFVAPRDRRAASAQRRTDARGRRPGRSKRAPMPGTRSMRPNCSATKRRDYDKVTDILDVWFDSGVTHEGVLAARPQRGLRKPADLYLEGSDQHRGWFQSSLLTGIAMDGAAPYQGRC